MKKVLSISPNVRLKTERELRGWSQKYVADQIGADHYYLSRWERGTTFPSPYYRQKLCDLFGKNAKELALLQPGSPTNDQEATLASAGLPSLPPASPPRVIHDPAIPLLLAGDKGLVGRDPLLRQLKEHVCRDQGVTLTALNGLPGVGKTSLVAALLQEPDVPESFSDGVLWAGLGPMPNVLSLLSHWGTLLELPSAEVSRLTSIEDWSRALRLAIGTRRLLLVIDDAWRIEAALAFKVGGPHCAYLVTTRFPQIALHFAPNDAIVVRELSEDDGLALLGRLAPDLAEREPQTARTLVRSVGGLPLALTIMGNYLRLQGYSGQPRRMRAALERLLDAQERLRLTESHALLERPPSLSADTPISLQTVIAVGDQQLDEQGQHTLRALSLFPAKPNSFSEEAALAVCGVPVETLDALSDAGLLESGEPGRYTLHQAIADYAQAHLTDRDVFAHLVAYFARYVEAHKKDYEALEQESSNIFAALQIASQEGRLADLTRCITALAPFLLARGLYTQAKDYLMQAEQAARSCSDTIGLAKALLYLGRIQFLHEGHNQAEAYHQEGLSLAREGEDQELLCQFLNWLGVIARNRGAYHQAEAYHQEGLALARQVGDQEQVTALLRGLGDDAVEQGHYEQGEMYLQEGVILARSRGDHERSGELLTNLGQVAYLRGNYQQGKDYSLEALEIARRIGYRHNLSVILGNLGGIAIEQGNYALAQEYLEEALETARQLALREQISTHLGNLGVLALEQGDDARAEAYLQEVLEMARQVGRRWLLSAVLYQWGQLRLKQQRWAEAATAFEEVREIASEGNQGYLALAIYGLARVSAAQGNTAEARELGQKSMHSLEVIGNRMAAEVKAWLLTLPNDDA